MNRTGQVGWQGALDELNRPFFQDAAGPVADSLFVDFRWSAGRLADSGRLAEQLGRSRYELWAGVDVEAAGWDSDTDWDAIVPADRDHVVSYGFYRPEWTLGHLPEGRTPGEFHAADDRFWSGEGLDPTRPGGTGSGWRAPATAVADRSTLTTLPFATTFNTGHGLRWYEDGAATSATPGTTSACRTGCRRDGGRSAPRGHAPTCPWTSPTPGAAAAACWFGALSTPPPPWSCSPPGCRRAPPRCSTSPIGSTRPRGR